MRTRRIVGWGLAAAAAAAVAVPMVSTGQSPAYALVAYPNGSINLKINELRDADQVVRDLAELGVRADIVYLPLGKRCADGRAPFVAGDDTPITPEMMADDDPATQRKIREWASHTDSARAIQPKDGITINPQFIGPGQIVMIEVAENVDKPAGSPGVVWMFTGRLTPGPIQPCRIVDNPDE
ncbi:hypothetical protein Aple_067840 [Acrocarpospora pleiomorpha]|uniref:PASTA domain-containing protein n=2 Tax=Acrocarpospora pleiomorpha TaxID=90975 RepID=A0A5M3XRD2_9ACTN|nr:hypothetical protein Aple_067840 [Acrocarpospora pleiomorpha]